MSSSTTSSTLSAIAHCWKINQDYASRLVNDLSDEQMILQPAPEGKAPSNHPAWTLAHLNTYIPIVGALLEGKPFDDPKDAPFGMQSKPEHDLSIYPAKAELIGEFAEGHETVSKLLASADPEILDQQVSLERWKSRMPNVATALLYLGMCHENQHLGQLSTWRRVQGMPSV